VALLRSGHLQDVDAENVAEELEGWLRLTSRRDFPKACPYDWKDILERPFEFDSVK
jgi:hypothetical protein